MSYTEPLASQADSSWSAFTEYTLPGSTSFDPVLGSNVPIQVSLLSNDGSIVFSSSSLLRKNLLHSIESSIQFISRSYLSQTNEVNLYFKSAQPIPYTPPAYNAVNFEWTVDNSNVIEGHQWEPIDFTFEAQELTNNVPDWLSLDFTFEIQDLIAQNALTNIEQPLLGFVCEWQTCLVSRLHESVYQYEPGFTSHEVIYTSVAEQFHGAAYRSESVAELHNTSWSFTGSQTHIAEYASLATTVASTAHTTTWTSLGTERVFQVHATSWASLGTESVSALHSATWASLGMESAFTLHASSYQSALLTAAQTTHDSLWASLGTDSVSALHSTTWASLGMNAVSAQHDAEWYSLSAATRVFSLHETSWTVTPDIRALHSTAWKSVIAASELHSSRWQSNVDNFRAHDVRYRSLTTTPTIQDGLVYVRV